MKLRQLLVCSIVLMAILIPNVVAQYADLQIAVDKTGRTTIEGLTDTDILVQNSPLFTSKKGQTWTFNFTTEQYYDSIVYELILPEYTAITYVESTVTARIISEDNHPLIAGSGRNDTFRLVVQYEVVEKNDSDVSFLDSTKGIATFWPVLAIIILGIGAFIFLPIKLFSAKHKLPTQQTAQYDDLPKRQKLIMECLTKNGSMTMKSIGETVVMPKSSLSRNIDSLERQNKIVKKPYGMSVRVEIVKSKSKEQE